MNKILISLLLLTSAQTYAKAVIRFPIVVENETGSVGIAKYKKQLAAKKLSIPDYIYIESSSDLNKIDEIRDQIENADLQYTNKKGKKIHTEMVYYSTISSYVDKTIKLPLCYLKSKDVSPLKGAEEATDLVLGLTDSVLSDQYSVVAVRYFGESDFRKDSNSYGSEDFEGLASYKKTKLNHGDVQIINVTNDSGDNDSEDILSLCK